MCKNEQRVLFLRYAAHFFIISYCKIIHIFKYSILCSSDAKCQTLFVAILIMITQKIVEEFKKLYQCCVLCERKCKVNRVRDKGYCRSYNEIKYVNAVKHHGEEPCISGSSGSGAIFFSSCNLNCVFCQNYEFSQLDSGSIISSVALTAEIENLLKSGVHNINLVSPTHFWPSIIESLSNIKNISVAIVNNTNSYESEELLNLLTDIVDIHLADFKYWNNENANKYSKAQNYVETAKRNIMKMFKSVGSIQIENGIAKKGILVRHLVMPGLSSESINILNWLYDNFGNNIYISLMSQYHPTYKSHLYPEINRTLYKKEYDKVIDYAVKIGIENIYIQEINPLISKLYLGG